MHLLTFPLFCVDMIVGIALSSHENDSIDVCAGSGLCELEYLVDIVPLSENPSQL